MEHRHGCKASQANAHTESTSNLQMAHRTYHVLPASFIHNDNSSALLRRASLPNMQVRGIMHSTDCLTKSDGGDIRRTTSITSMRSVTGMKSLLPLKLASPQLSEREREWPSPASIQRSTFGLPVKAPTSPSILERRAKHSFVPPPMVIRPEKYRDTPIYTERGSPLLGRAYYTDEDICFSCAPPGSSCDESCIIHDYENSSREPSGGGDWLKSLPENFGDNSEPSSTSSGPRDSDLSFKCRGESNFETPLFRDEAAWLSSSSPPRPAVEFSSLNPKVMPPENETDGWLDDASSCDGDDEVLACAMALATSRAHVVDVNHLSGITVDIPPRSSSFAGTRRPMTPDGGRKSRMSFHSSVYGRMGSYFSDSWSEDDDEALRQLPFPTLPVLPGSRFDLARTSPPLSPKRESGWPSSPPPMPAQSDSRANLHKFTSFQTRPDDSFEPPRFDPSNALCILSALEDSTSKFPSTMLLPDTPCISAIRIQPRPSSSNHPPISDTATLSSTGLGNSPLPQPSRRETTSFLSHQQHPSISTIDHPLPLQSSPVTPAPFQFPLFNHHSPPRHPSSHYSTPPPLPLSHPNLHPLQTIFPTASNFLLTALYAHILAYTYLTTQLTLTHAPPLPKKPRNPPPPNPAHPLNIPFYTTTSHALPSKVAAVLGAPVMAARPLTRQVDVIKGAVVVKSSDGGHARVADVRERVRGCIGWLVGEIGVRDGEEMSGEGGVSGVLLRALGEVVRGCEGRGEVGCL